MRPFDFIFMLTRNDRTVPEAPAHVETALQAGIRHIGFKDVGLPFAALHELAELIREGGASTYLEVVSLDRESEIRSVKAAVELGVDYLLGGTHAEDALPLLEGSAIRYYPFPGRIVGHPSILEGSQAEIVGSAVKLASYPGVAGLDLLAYRSAINVAPLMDAVCRSVAKPVIVAGSVDHPEQIEDIRRSGAAGFTVGTSALDGRFPAADATLHSQLEAISDCCRRGDSARSCQERKGLAG
ncbi:4-hydroxythreonine-4-phosphate dehydrogenase [Agrobacterium sp. 22-226-1]